jgi:2-polyprenyl-3-methyl-5-hydroxy-6-metoxy-1,4-benzoquinol methylase
VNTLIAIANHGHGNRQYLDQLLAAHRDINPNAHIVLLSNIDKHVPPGVELRVGRPDDNPFSLPFAHRQLFRERLDDFDLFIYSEDDTLLTSREYNAFLAAQANLEPNEIAGFLRFEQAPDGARTISTIHSFFRWLPHTVVERDGELFAQHTNPHAAFFIATRDQLRRAFDSGGFDVPPHDERLGFLETAASDIYTQSGLTRLLPLDRIDDVLLHHLPNKYIGKLGIPLAELHQQIDALRRIHAGELPADSLLQPETRLRHAAFSKHVHRPPELAILDAIPSTARSVLSIAAGAGEFEHPLLERGAHVTAIPIDAVLGACAQRRGISVRFATGPLEHAVRQHDDDPHDAVLLESVLHLVEDPEAIADAALACLAPGGVLVATVPNTAALRARRDARRSPHSRIRSYAQAGLHPADVGWLRRVLSNAGARRVDITYRAATTASRLGSILAQHAPRWATGDVIAVASR